MTNSEILNKKIDIKEFVEKYNSFATDNLKENYVKNTLVIKDYVPWVQKVLMAKKIVEGTCSKYVKDNDNNAKITKIPEYNSPMRYIMFMKYLLSTWTNLNIDDKGWIDYQYDLLSSSGVLNVIRNLIPKNEYIEFQTILNMELDDFRDNNSFINILANIISGIDVNELIKNVDLEKLNIDLNKLNINK